MKPRVERSFGIVSSDRLERSGKRFLREIECMSYAEIGEIMKLEEGTVKSKLHRARTAFMKRMKKAQAGGPWSGEEG